MKKVFSIVAIALVAMTFASCEKTYTCECTVTLLGQTTTSETTIEAKKADAEATCDAGDVAITGTGDLATGVECKIK
jgi:hypothetical protein